MELLTTKEVATLLKISPDKLAKLRQQGLGPRFARIGGSIRYDKKDVEQWVETTKKEEKNSN